MKDVLLTTSENVSGWEILEYKYPVFSHVVSGAGFLSEFNASFSELFGSRSESYEKRLQSLNQRALEILKLRAREAGANCIVGLRVDSDQISGKSAQLFMITAYGTAVVAKNLKSHVTVNTGKEIDISSVKDRTRLLRLISQLNEQNFKVSYDDLELIAESKMPIFKDVIVDKLKKNLLVNMPTQDTQRALASYTKYFSLIDDKDVLKVLYNTLLKETDLKVITGVFLILSSNDLLDYNEIESLLISGSIEVKIQALKLLTADKPYYSLSDINEINHLIKVINGNFPPIGTISSKKGFLSSNEKEVWICKCGKNNEMNETYCYNCLNDIYGFSSEDIKPVAIIDFLQRKAIAIGELISN